MIPSDLTLIPTEKWWRMVLHLANSLVIFGKEGVMKRQF